MDNSSSWWTQTGPGLWGNSSSGDRTYFSQSSVAGDARAVIGVPTDDQQVEFLVRPTTFAGTGSGDKWFGAIARYTDEFNYYYVSLRSSGSISLRKLTNRTIGVLASASMPVSVGTWYRLRLEAVGSRLRVYVNGTLMLEATDTAHARGTTGMMTYRTAAEFDAFRATQP
jgi:pectate lyase